ncbi:YgaP family membrane protein [Natrarchaeobius chitinivorans]|uniref:DUF2892 domain-containing protein n=1 Tax=Natrarchaeobius chitinivorans TaxID=1679083 RepID=A0A3N6MDF7_NATCH|nr:DUF2892 domain-containing protein [Natrarchaeobius chitinivorans]RQG94660.1 DUF2892 domain-containing protein [Natrarchaeobius chitinivorans]
MEKNVGGYDRPLRFLIGAALLTFGYRNREQTVGTIAFLMGSDLFSTAVIQRCPVSAVFGIDTCNGG